MGGKGTGAKVHALNVELAGFFRCPQAKGECEIGKGCVGRDRDAGLGECVPQLLGRLGFGEYRDNEQRLHQSGWGGWVVVEQIGKQGAASGERVFLGAEGFEVEPSGGHKRGEAF